MNVLIAPDSFKDALSAKRVAQSLKKGFLKILPEARVKLLPLADGGEGTVESVMEATGGEILKIRVHDPLLRETVGTLGLSGDGTTGVLEMASASGLEKLLPEERNPWITTTYGTGELIREALDRGCTRILIGIGGSATNDGGMGMAEALGAVFLDRNGKKLNPGGGSLGGLEKIDMSGLDPRIKDTEIKVACDVTNPLTGPDGASSVYGPQKGAHPEMVQRLDNNLRRLATAIRDQLGIDIETIPGSGAAGGLGAGLMAFVKGVLVPGFEMVSKAVDLEKAIRETDLVITGEGKIDKQALFGKTVMGIARLSSVHHKPVIAVGGAIEPGSEKLYQEGISVILPVAEKPGTLEEAIRHTGMLLEHCGERIARLIRVGEEISHRPG